MHYFKNKHRFFLPYKNKQKIFYIKIILNIFYRLYYFNIIRTKKYACKKLILMYFFLYFDYKHSQKLAICFS